MHVLVNPFTHTRMYARTHACTHARTHALTHTYTINARRETCRSYRKKERNEWRNESGHRERGRKREREGERERDFTETEEYPQPGHTQLTHGERVNCNLASETDGGSQVVCAHPEKTPEQGQRRGGGGAVLEGKVCE